MPAASGYVQSEKHGLLAAAMQREGHLRQNISFPKSQGGAPLWEDTYVYAILASERLLALQKTDLEKENA